MINVDVVINSFVNITKIMTVESSGDSLLSWPPIDLIQLQITIEEDRPGSREHSILF